MSEIHAIMTGGFATMGGAIIALYIGIGVSFQPSFDMISKVNWEERIATSTLENALSHCVC